MGMAEQLEGRTLKDTWTVGKKLDFGDEHTGGNFSMCYEVENKNGNKGFLKVLDFSKLLQHMDPAQVLKAATSAFIFEKGMLSKTIGLDRVVRLLDDGVEVFDTPKYRDTIQYLIFENAKNDVRSQAKLAKRLDSAWTLRCLHQVSVGIQQLHGHDIAHQDIKPSNILVFEGIGSKIGDLGRSVDKNSNDTQPHENLTIAGDPTYAPPELLYGYVHPNWIKRRLGCDIYQLGSLMCYFFAGTNFTAFLASHMDTSYHWDRWSGPLRRCVALC